MKIQKPKISVIMPTYNGAKFIKKSIASVLAQTLKDFELIIINDGSTDKTRAVVKKCRDSRIAYIENKKNLGVSKARNVGLKHARGAYIAYCDHDDIYYRSHLQHFSDILDKNPEIGLVYGDYLVIGYQKPIILPWSRNNFFKKELEKYNSIGAPLNVMHRIECARKTGGFDESAAINKNSAEDYDLWLRISDHFKCFHLKELSSKFVYHQKNRTFNVNFAKSNKYILKKRLRKYKSKKLLKQLNNAFPPESGESCHLVNPQKRYDIPLCLGSYHLSRGNFRRALSYFNRSLALTAKPRNESKTDLKKDVQLIKFALARANLCLGNFDSAAKFFRDILLANPQNMEARNLLARCYLNVGKGALAIKLLSRASDAYSHSLRGAHYFSKRIYSLAVKEFEKSAGMSLLPSAQTYNMGVALLRMGKIKESKRVLTRLQQRHHGYENIDKILMRLEFKNADIPIKPMVSVIIPTFNRSKLVIRAIKSVLNQSLKDFELIVVNDGSLDNTKGLVGKLSDPRIIYVKQPNKGPSSARNTGIRYAMGKYIAYLDDDDVFMPCHLNTLVKFLEANPKVGLAHTDYLYYFLNEKPYRRITYSPNNNRLGSGHLPGTSFLAHRKECIDKVGLFDVKLKNGQDTDMWLRIADHYKIKHISKVTGKCYYHYANISFKKNTKKFAILLIKKQLGQKRKDKNFKKYMRSNYMSIIESLLNLGDTKYASKLADEFYKTDKNYNSISCLGMCDIARCDFSGAYRKFKKAMLLHRQSKLKNQDINAIRMHCLYAQCLHCMGNTKSAVKFLYGTLRVIPNNQSIKNMLAFCLINEKKYQKAANMVKYTTNADGRFLRAAINFLQGNFTKSAKQFKTLSILYPKNLKTHFNLAISYIKIGKISEAINIAQRILKIDSGYSPAKQLLRRLK